MTLLELRHERDRLRRVALASGAAKGGTDEYGYWCNADPEHVRRYRDAVYAVEAALRGTKYQGANPEEI